MWTAVPCGLHTHHDEVPHACGFGHQGGDAAAAGHQDDFKGLRVEEVVEQLGGFPWVALRKTTRKTVRQMDRWTRESIMRGTNELMGLEMMEGGRRLEERIKGRMKENRRNKCK